MPQQAVDIAIDISDPTEAEVNGNLLKFEPSGWDELQTVHITGLDDTFDDGSVPYNVTFTMSSSDPAFAAKLHSPQVVGGMNLDDDVSEILVYFDANISLPTPIVQNTEEATSGKWLEIFFNIILRANGQRGA